MVRVDPARPQARPASASLAPSRESTPERGTRIPSVGDGKDEDDWSYEGKSMTLRDILVRAGDATFAHFDILRERYLSFFSLSTLAQGRTGPDGGTYFHLGTLIVPCATLNAATPRWQGFRTCLALIALPPSAPRVPRTPGSGCPADFNPFSFFWPRCFGLIDPIINAIVFIADEEDVDVADETLGWE